MTQYNWDLMPAELRSKLLELASMDESLSSVKWSGFEPDEKRKLNEALWGKTGGQATIKDVPQ